MNEKFTKYGIKIYNRPLDEATRNDLISKSKQSGKGRQRFKRRVKSSVSHNVRQYNQIDMNKLFKQDILTVNIQVNGETDDYIVKISFGGFLEILQDELKRNNDRLDLRTITRALLTGFNKGNVYINCNCLFPTTEIKLLDGRTLTIEQLYEEYQKGEKLYVYSTDSNGDFKPGEVEKVWVAGSSEEFIRVVLDNDEEILTTPDHRYMLRDGSYKNASDLVVGESLMPLYFGRTKTGYETVKYNSTGKYHSTYKIVAETYKQQEIEEAKKRVAPDNKMRYEVAIHHSDFNKDNNAPSNLIPMTAEEHWLYHSSLLKEKWKDKDFREAQSQRATEWIKKLNANPTEKMAAARKKFTNAGKMRNYDEDRKKQQSEIAKKALNGYWANLSPEESKRMRTKNKGEEWKSHLSLAHKDYWKNLSEKEYEDRVSKIRQTNQREDLRKKSSERMKRFRGNLKADPIKAAEYNQKSLTTRVKIILERIIAAGETPSPETYEKYRTKGYPRYTKVFADWGEVSKHFNLNHSVKHIEKITVKSTPVYDISVKEYDNFLVGAGVILHNCKDFFYRFGYYATKNQFDNYALTGKKTKWKDKNPGKINYSGVSDPQLIPSNITNPNDTLGSACKHVLLVLSNTNWMIKVASVINNYIRYMSTAAQYQKVYADVIYPAVYGKPYEEPVQLAFGDRNYAPSSKKFLNKANTYQGRDTGGKFTKGNEYEIKPSDKQAENDITLFDNDTID